jgi:DNA-binding MarR family transcriptional regulator
LSSASQETPETKVEVLGKLARELRQFTSLRASFFRVAAARLGLAVTDLQVLDILDILDLTGGTSAGQLAEVTGLTTGAITKILNRLEEAGLVRREPDQSDGRKVVVRLKEGGDKLLEVRSLLNTTPAWDAAASRFDTEKLAFLLEFLQQANEMSQNEIVQLQGGSSGKLAIYSAPLEDLESGKLAITCGISQLIVRADERMDNLYQARCEGPVPDVKANEGVVTIRYPRRLLGLGRAEGTADVALTTAVPWRIALKGGSAEIIGELGGLDLAGLEVKGGFSKIHLVLPAPSGAVPIRILGGAPEIVVRRPAGVAARVQVKGWVAETIFDDQTISGAGNNMRLQSPGYDPTAPGYTIEITSYATRVAVTTA